MNFFMKKPESDPANPLRKLERQTSQSESEVKTMTTTRDSASPIDAADEELIDTLIAISVVAKRLAAKLRQSNEKQSESEEPKNE